MARAEAEEFNPEAEGYEERIRIAKEDGREATESALKKKLKKSNKEWEKKRKTQQGIELGEFRKTSTSRPNPLYFVPPTEEFEEETSFSSSLSDKFKEGIREEQREEVLKYYPKMMDNVIITSEAGGVLFIGLYGGDVRDREPLLTREGDINVIHGPLAEALGPLGEDLEMAQKFRPEIQWKKFNFRPLGDLIQVQKKGESGEKSWIHLNQKIIQKWQLKNLINQWKNY